MPSSSRPLASSLRVKADCERIRRSFFLLSSSCTLSWCHMPLLVQRHSQLHPPQLALLPTSLFASLRPPLLLVSLSLTLYISACLCGCVWMCAGARVLTLHLLKHKESVIGNYVTTDRLCVEGRDCCCPRHASEKHITCILVTRLFSGPNSARNESMRVTVTA